MNCVLFSPFFICRNVGTKIFIYKCRQRFSYTQRESDFAIFVDNCCRRRRCSVAAADHWFYLLLDIAHRNDCHTVPSHKTVTIGIGRRNEDWQVCVQYQPSYHSIYHCNRIKQETKTKESNKISHAQLHRFTLSFVPFSIDFHFLLRRLIYKSRRSDSIIYCHYFKNGLTFRSPILFFKKIEYPDFFPFSGHWFIFELHIRVWSIFRIQFIKRLLKEQTNKETYFFWLNNLTI